MTNYCYGHNMPGYMPDGDGPGPFDDDTGLTFDDAKRGLIADMLGDADARAMEGDETAAENLTHAAEDVNLWSGPDSIHVEDETDSEHALGRVYWIAVDES